jgi:oligopeptide transport system permease protein
MPDRRAARRFFKNPVAVASTILLLAILTAIVFGPLFFPVGHTMPGPQSFSPPSLQHLFGTDLNGRDLLYRVLTGGRVSMLVGLCGALVSLFIGTSYGLIAGYAGGKLDNLLMRIVDVLYSVPRLIFILICINAFNANLQQFASKLGWEWLIFSSRIAILIVSLGVIEWLTLARIVRGQTLALKNRPFISAATVLGQSQRNILLRHLLPNLLGVIAIYLTLTIPAVVIDESFLSFLGLGVQAPAASWGSLLADGAASLNPIRIRWWVVVFPAAIMAVTLLALNFLGDALRDALDPNRMEN